MWLGAAAFARLRMPVLGRNELRQKRNVVMARSWLEGLTGASKHNHRTCLGGFPENSSHRIGTLLHRFLQAASRYRFNSGQNRFLLHVIGKARATRR